MKQKNLAGILAVLVLLVGLPLGFYLYFDSKVPTPPPAPKSYGKAPYFLLKTQDGNDLSSDDLKGFIYVADFFFTSCNTVCPQLSEQMAKVQESYKTEPRIRLLSFTINPEVDSPAVLKEYAARYGAMPDKWFFLTHDSASYIRDSVVVGGFKVPAVPDNAEPGQFTHTDRFMVIDAEGVIRGLYDVMQEGQIDSMYNHIERLLVEKKRKAEVRGEG
jgi:protein SCO1